MGSKREGRGSAPKDDETTRGAGSGEGEVEVGEKEGRVGAEDERQGHISKGKRTTTTMTTSLTSKTTPPTTMMTPSKTTSLTPTTHRVAGDDFFPSGEEME